METAEGEYPFSLSHLQPEYVGEISRRLCSMEPWLTLGYKPELFTLYLLRADPALKRYSIEVSGTVAGVFAVRYPWLFGSFIELVALFDGFRGQGIGSRLVELVSRQYQSPNIWATVSSFNLEAQHFYSRMGFEQTAVLDDLIKPGWNEILLRKRNR
ncbi:MAG: GNAT family N-acetyltransferase [Syntrophobacteraceae bacterium]